MRLLVVDSISSLITPILGGSGSHGKDYNISQFPGILGNYIFFKKKKIKKFTRKTLLLY